MNYSILSFAVFLLAVDSTFSLQCYACSEKYRLCDNPEPTACESKDNICVKLTKARGLGTYYRCDHWHPDCEDYPDNCIDCNTDLCNVPDNTTQDSLKCYECYYDEFSRVSNFSDLENCKVREKQVRCYPNEKCASASSELELRRYHGCVKDTKNFCKQHNFEKCTSCDKDLCNEINRKLTFLDCDRCYSGKTSDEKFKKFKPCSDPEGVTCGHGLQCAAAYDTLGDRRYHDCGPISNKTDEFCEKYGFDHCELCDDRDWCNNPKAKKKNCYNCIFRDPNSKHLVSQFPNNLPSCSQPLISPCVYGRCLTLNERKKNMYGKLIATIHACVKDTETYRKDCDKRGILCDYCDEDLCNKVKRETATASSRRTSSAEVLKNNTVSLLNLLFIVIIIRAAL